MTRDELHQRAIRLMGEYYRALKECRAAVGKERRDLAVVCSEKARDAQAAVDAYYASGRH